MKDCAKSVSPSTVLELRKILVDNLVCAFGFSVFCIFGIIFSICSAILLGEIYSAFVASTASVAFFGVWALIFDFICFANIILVALIKFDVGNRVCKWSRTKVLEPFLMLHFHNRSRTKNVLRLIQQELQEIQELEELDSIL